MGLLDIFRISRIKRENADLKQAVDNLQSKLNSLSIRSTQKRKENWITSTNRLKNADLLNSSRRNELIL